MPALYTHNQIAEMTFNKLGQPNYLKKHYNEYILGSIGLDFFLYQNILHPYKANNINQHAQVCLYHHHNDFLAYLLSATAKEVDLMMYYLGFLTNYCANKTIRPYTYFGAEKPEGGYEMHDVYKFDQIIDTFYYKKINLAGMPEQNLAFKNINRKFLVKVSKMLSIAINKTNNSRVIRAGAIERAFDDANTFTSKQPSSSSISLNKSKKQMIDAMSPPSYIQGNDVMNLSHRQWRSPWDDSTAQNHSVTDLIKKSVDESISLIELVNGYFVDEVSMDDISNAIGNIDFDGRAS